MPKKDKKKSAEKKARVAEKQGKKAAQKEKKNKTKGRTGDDESDADDVDLDAVLAEYARQQALFLKVTEETCGPPSPRSSATLLASPSNDKELFLFGGEYFNGATATFFNDLLIYHVERDEWRQVKSPNSPLPRSGHAWCRGGNTGGVYLFGGEFSSPKQGTFYHYNDFWYLDPLSREWTRLESKGKTPPARSGHRMTYHKNYIVLFGGFQDTSQQTKYLQDLWIYDCQAFVWHSPTLPPASPKPDPRSSFSFLPSESGAALCGGYSRIKATLAAGKQVKRGAQATKSVMKPVVHQDTYFLRITQPVAGGQAGPAVRWERRKRPVNAPNPTRAGATMAFHKGRGIHFGGVHDVEESEEGIESEFFDALFAWNIERNRFFPLTVRRPRGPIKTRAAETSGRRGRRKADEDELLRNLAALETGKSLTDADLMEPQDLVEVRGDGAAERPSKTLSMEMPHKRFNAQLAVQSDVLYIYGGTFEQGDREFTFDDMFAIDLNKLDGVREIFKREPENWAGRDDKDSEEDDDEEDEEDDEDEGTAAGDDSDDGQDDAGTETVQAIPEDRSSGQGAAFSESEVDDTQTQTSSLLDTLPHPRPFESLRSFFTRTSDEWQNLLLEALKHQNIASAEAQSVKELRKAAFDRAEEKWWDCREEIRELEDEQEEAGIGDVVSLGERGGTGGVPTRRR